MSHFFAEMWIKWTLLLLTQLLTGVTVFGSGELTAKQKFWATESVRECAGAGAGRGGCLPSSPPTTPPPSPAGWRRTPATFPPPPHSRKQLASHRWLLDLPKRINFFQAKSRYFVMQIKEKTTYCFIYYRNYLRLNNSKFWIDNPKWIF